MNVIGEPIDEKGPVVTKMELPIHRDAPAFDEQGSGAELLITGMFHLLRSKIVSPSNNKFNSLLLLNRY